jgi:hypothetical protein
MQQIYAMHFHDQSMLNRHFQHFRTQQFSQTCLIFILLVAQFMCWKPLCKQERNILYSPYHAASVPLILNTQTALVSPQFHCVYDDKFETVHYEKNVTSLWQQKANMSDMHEDQIASLPTSTKLQRTLTDYSQSSIPPALLQLPQMLQQAVPQQITTTVQHQTENRTTKRTLPCTQHSIPSDNVQHEQTVYPAT